MGHGWKFDKSVTFWVLSLSLRSIGKWHSRLKYKQPVLEKVKNHPGGLKPKACGSECGAPALPGGKLWQEGEGECQHIGKKRKKIEEKIE